MVIVMLFQGILHITGVKVSERLLLAYVEIHTQETQEYATLVPDGGGGSTRWFFTIAWKYH